VTISNANESDDDIQPTRPGIITDIQPSPRKNIPPSKTTSGGTTISAVVRQPIVKATPTTEKFSSDRYEENLIRNFLSCFCLK